MAASPSTRVLDSNTIPSKFKTTHNTDGLPGYGALDWFRPAGSIVGLPVGGTVEYTRPARTGPGVYGTHIAMKLDNGKRVFMTHFDRVFVRAGERVEAQEPLGTVHAYGKASHIHIGVEGAADRGADVVLGSDGGGGLDIPGRIRRGIEGANPLDPVDPDNDSDDGPAGILNEPWGDLKGQLPRLAQLIAGGALLLIGLLLLGKQVAR